MRGSGIYSEDFVMNVTCSECDHTFEADVTADDWGNINNDLECEKCGETFNFTQEAGDEQGDDDERYEAWRDSQLFDN